MPYSKPWISHQEQLDRLKQRGLAVTDDKKALSYLKRIGYYRLSGYWYPFRERSELCCLIDGTKRKREKRIEWHWTSSSPAQPLNRR